MNVCTAFTQHGQNKRRMFLLFSRVRRLAALPMPALLVLLLFGFATVGAAAQAVSSAASQSIDSVLADAARPARIRPVAQVAAEQTAPPTFFPHPDATRYFVAGQANIIFQAHGPFHSPYEGTNSLLGRGEYKTSLVGTLYMGAELVRNPARHLEAIYDEESAGGRGISEAVGLAGFTNLDVVRNPNLGPIPYLARVQLHQTIGFTSKTVVSARGPFSLATKTPERRLELRVGKMGLPDFFDLNSIGTDSHLQFLNWSTDNNGAWDYAADTRGYTYGAVAEYDDKNWSARYGLATMPTVANGINFDWSLKRASGQNMEVEWRHGLLGTLLPPERKGTMRLLGYVNHGNMGDYRQQNIKIPGRPDANSGDYLAPATVHCEIWHGNQRRAGDDKESARLRPLRLERGTARELCLHGGRSDNRTGRGFAGRRWNRGDDKVGLAFVSNAIKRDHQAYLRLGGLGFLLGDGNLNYAREDILEGYYTVHTWRGLYYALDAQYIDHPGYNQDRGPVLVESVRMHVDF